MLSAQSGTVVTASQLLGTDKEEKAAAARAAQQQLDKLLKRVRKRAPVQNDGVYEEFDDGADEVRRKKRLTSG